MEDVALGEILKKGREKKGLSIEDVARITRIRKEYLTALEAEDYTKLPERTYALGYFRSYAKFLDIENIEKLVSQLDDSFFFERPRYSNQKGQVFLDDEYGVINTLKKKLGGGNSQEEVDEYENDHPEHSKKNEGLNQSKESYKERESFDFKNNKKETREEGGFSSHGKLIIVLCVFLFIFLFLGYKLLFSGSSSKDTEDSVVATKESPDDKKIDSIIDNNYVVVENTKTENPSANKVPNQQLTIKSQNPQEPVAQDVDNINIHAGTANNQGATNSVNQNVETQVDTSEKPKIEMRNWAKPTRNYQISIAFAEDVWVQIYKQGEPNVVYLDKIFKAGDIFDVPKVDNIAMNVGNYRGIKILVDSQEITLSSPRRNSVVLNNVILEKNSLLEKYKAN